MPRNKSDAYRRDRNRPSLPSPSGRADFTHLSGVERPHFKTALLYIFVLFVQTLVPVFSYGQEAATSAELAKRRNRIAALSDSDRAELTRKFRNFQELPETDRAQLRELHRKVSANPALNQTMQRYCDWLKDLDVAQRAQLREADTPEKKRVAVERIREEQRKQRDENTRVNDPREIDSKKFPLPQLATSTELKDLMGGLETHLNKLNVIDPGQIEKLKKLTGTMRYKRILQLLATTRQPKEGSGQSGPKIPEEFQMMLKQVAPEQLMRKGSGAVAERMGGTQRILMWLLISLQEEAKQELSQPDGDELREALFHTLSSQKQAEFLQTAPEAQARFLYWFHIDELRNAFLEAFDLPRFLLGEGARPPGEGRPRPEREEGQGPRDERPGRFPLRGAAAPFSGPRRDKPASEEERPLQEKDRKEPRPEPDRRDDQD